jgi:hypothetical protein
MLWIRFDRGVAYSHPIGRDSTRYNTIRFEISNNNLDSNKVNHKTASTLATKAGRSANFFVWPQLLSLRRLNNSFDNLSTASAAAGKCNLANSTTTPDKPQRTKSDHRARPSSRMFACPSTVSEEGVACGTFIIEKN